MWRIEGTQASLSGPQLLARVNLRQPHFGLADVAWLDRTLADVRLLQAQLPDAGAGQRLVEAYVRGQDLIATYEAASEEKSATQMYWRYVEHADLEAAGVELIVSVRTELLDADASLTLGSELACRELVQAVDQDATRFLPAPVAGTPGNRPAHLDGVGLLIHRVTDAVSVLEMLHPADFSALELVADAGSTGRVRSRFRLFQERLEKGVIRRARAQTLLCRPADDEAIARECYLRLRASEAPLTT